jgi:hypothetical protein
MKKNQKKLELHKQTLRKLKTNIKAGIGKTRGCGDSNGCVSDGVCPSVGQTAC